MNEMQLSLIKEIVPLCEAASIPCWLRGGWAVDFALGRVTREHEDIDFFAWAREATALARLLETAGFRELGGPPPEAQRNFTKDGEEVQIALLDINEQGQVVVAGGPWAGARWPDGMLGSHVGRIGEITVPIVSPSVQIEIKEKFREWRPDRLRNPKHDADIARLRESLAENKE